MSTWRWVVLALLSCAAGCAAHVEPPRAGARSPFGGQAADADPREGATDDESLAQASRPRLPVVSVDVEPPRDVACLLTEKRFSGRLQLRPAGPVFAHVAEAPTSMAISTKVGDAAYLTVEDNMTLHGFVDAPTLFMLRATPLGGFVVPLSSTKIDVEPIAEGRIAVSLDVSRVFVRPTRLREEMGCDAVSFVDRGYDARAALRLAPGDRVGLRKDAPLTLTADGAVVAEVRRSAPASISASRAMGGERRVVIDAVTFLAFGWVPDEAVDPNEAGGVGGFFGRGRFDAASRHEPRPSRCSHALWVLAEVGGERAEVGSLHAEVPFARTTELATDDPALAPIALLGGRLTLEGGARLLVRKADLVDCAG